jgi:hypothetical protein
LGDKYFDFKKYAGDFKFFAFAFENIEAPYHFKLIIEPKLS